MINTEEFSERLQKVIDFYNLSASAFADKIGVQRSSISHILSGRNKPSLDFVMKVLNAFKEVELYWLLNGKGAFPKDPQINIKPPIEKKITTPPLTDSANTSSKDIERIVIFYKDGSFKSFAN